jgi:glycosyltransferase involved in cell wall biosynthesis
MNSTAEAESHDKSVGRRVLYVWFADYPWDVRVQKVIIGLTQAGWMVDVTARNKKKLSDTEVVDGATIHRLRRLPFIGAVLNGALSFPAFVNPRWACHIARIARRTRPRIILVRDLPLAPAAIWVGWLWGIPVVLDMAENYPGQLRTLWETGIARPIDLLIRNPKLAAMVERWVLQRVDAVICVIEESASRIRRLGVPEQKIAIVRNTPFSDATHQLKPRPSSDRPLVIAYLGIVERHRGVHDLVRAVAECRRRELHVNLQVIGDGSGLRDIKDLAIQLGVLGHGVDLLGRMENMQALGIVANADVGAIPHVPCDAWNATIPNKLFDYMSLGLPILSSNVGPVERIVLEEACGVCYRSGDIIDLVAAIERLRSPEGRNRMAVAGMEAVKLRYNWHLDAQRLDRALVEVLAAHKKPTRPAGR